MRYFFDTEFVEDGVTIDLISIAIVAEDGREYYAVHGEIDGKYDRYKKALAHPFVSENVLPYVKRAVESGEAVVRWSDELPIDIIQFTNPEKYGEPEFWADFASYDWVALCQLYGPMVNLPKGFPFYVRDVQQFRKMVSEYIKPIERIKDIYGTIEHDALWDARNVMNKWKVCDEAMKK